MIFEKSVSTRLESFFEKVVCLQAINSRTEQDCKKLQYHQSLQRQNNIIEGRACASVALKIASL